MTTKGLRRALCVFWGSDLNKRLKLYGFNNLTKTLSFNIYDICYASNKEQRESYIAYIDEYYNSDRLHKILRRVVDEIEAHILNIATQDYDPQGASVTMLIAEEEMRVPNLSVAAHLDKSHLTVHTYPESHPQKGLCTFRVDIDVSTCGAISPLRALPLLIDSFDSDIITMDYRVRGFTRDHAGRKVFIDHPINSVQEFIPERIKERYRMIDTNLYDERIFHTSMLLNEIDLDNYLFNIDAADLNKKTKKRITDMLEKEMQEIFYARNFK